MERLTISIHVPAWGTTIRNLGFSLILDISIHVPAWGTTKDIEKQVIEKSISIHVPAWGTTYLTTRNMRAAIFQSTFPRGERLKKPHVDKLVR